MSKVMKGVKTGDAWAQLQSFYLKRMALSYAELYMFDQTIKQIASCSDPATKVNHEVLFDS